MARLSIIIPTHNTGLYLVEAVESVLAQTYKDFELIVIDDGSTDNTHSRLAPYLSELQYIYQENQERSVARNRGIAASQGEYVAFLDADDFWVPTKLEEQVQFLDGHPRSGAVFCMLQAVSSTGERLNRPQFVQPWIDTEDLFPKLLMGNFLGCSSILIRRSVLDDIGGFDPQLRYIEDWNFNLKVASHCPTGCVPRALTSYRQYAGYYPARVAHYNVQDAAVRMLEELLQNMPQERCSLSLRTQAVSNAWWNGAKLDYALGQIIDAQRRFAQALELDNLFVECPVRFVEDIVDYALNLYQVHPTPFQIAEQFVRTVFQNLPESALGLASYYRPAIGRLHAGYVFSASAAALPSEERARLWVHALRAVTNDLSWRRNRGLFSIGFKSSVDALLVSPFRREKSPGRYRI